MTDDVGVGVGAGGDALRSPIVNALRSPSIAQNECICVGLSSKNEPIYMDTIIDKNIMMSYLPY